MYFFFTVFIGWSLLSLCVGFIEIIFGFQPESLKNTILIYIVVGNIVMILYKIKSPFNQLGENPFIALKKIDLKLFFKDVYYAIWWPYYITNNINSSKKD
jgi:hypothetical protein